MDTNEKLIEEAAKVVHSEHKNLLNLRDSERVARTALAVFEKAQAPTDDEREALLRAIINAPESGDALHVAEAERVRDAILAAGFRRSVVPESSADCPQPCVHLSQEDAREGRTCAEHPCTCPKPQGEPSDALNLDYLEAVANAATPGPWTDFDDDGEAYSRPPATGAFLVEYGADAEQKMRDIRYIASVDPQTILALIALVRTAVTEQGENR